MSLAGDVKGRANGKWVRMGDGDDGDDGDDDDGGAGDGDDGEVDNN